METPLLSPKGHGLGSQKPYEPSPLFPQRKTSIASVNTDLLGGGSAMLDMEAAMNRKERLDSIPPINEDLYDYGLRGVEEKIQSLTGVLPPPAPEPAPLPDPELPLLAEEEKKVESSLRVTLPIPSTRPKKSEENAAATPEAENMKEEGPQEGSIQGKVLKTIEQNFELQRFPGPPSVTVPKIGTLTVEQRREKVQKYWAKKRRRTWRKKVSYSCRKEMASKRLRIKGRFVSREQAFAQLGVAPEEISDQNVLNNLISEKICESSKSGGEKSGRRKRARARKARPTEEAKRPGAVGESDYHLRRKRSRPEPKFVFEIPVLTTKVFALHRARADNVPEAHKKYHMHARRSQQ